MAHILLVIRTVVIASLACILTFIAAQAQNTCSQTLIKAQFSYYEGKADEVPDLLESCLKEGFTDEEKLQAYRLLTLTYLYMNDPQQAEETLLAFLRLNPIYKINEATDPAEFINLYKQFRTWPVYLVGVKAGTHASFVRLTKPYSLDNTHTSTSAYTSKLSYQIGVSLEIPLTKKLSLSPEFYVTSKKFLYNAHLFGYEKLSFNETQNRIELPVLLTYTKHNKKFSPFVSAGITSNVILNANGQLVRTDNIQINEAQKEVTGPNITLNHQRKLINFSGTVGGGMKYARKKNIITLEVRYNMGLTNLARPKARYTDNELIYKYGYLDNDFTLSSLWVSAGYIIPIYQPRKLFRKAATEEKE